MKTNTAHKVVSTVRKLYPLPNVEGLRGVSTTQLYAMLPELPQSTIRRVAGSLVNKGQMTRVSDGFFSPICKGVVEACSWTPLDYDAVVNMVESRDNETPQQKEERIADELLKAQNSNSLSTLTIQSKGPYPFYRTMYVASETLRDNTYSLVQDLVLNKN